MSDAALVARWQFKTIEWRTGDCTYGLGARFRARIFAITFATGVVTGIPLEFQFGANWARCSHVAGRVVGQTLFMAGVFAFFAESVGALIVTTIGSVVAGPYPMLLPFLNPGVHPGLDIYKATSPEGSLITALGVYLFGMALVVLYMVNVYRGWRGKVQSVYH